VAATRLLLGLLLLAIVAGPARGEGFIGLRSGYYKERSTRVVQPMLDAQADVSEDGTVSAHALVDSITSASPAAGTAVEFTERRYEAGVGYAHRFGLFQLGAYVRSSTEVDYTSNTGSLTARLELFDRNLTIQLAVARGYDTITNGVSSGPSTPRIEEHLSTGLTSLSFTQLLGPRLVASLTFDLADLHGYQANVYRRVFGGATPTPERVPDLRLRAAVHAGLRGYLPTRSTWVLGYRFYADDWGVLAHTAEARWIQEIVPDLELRARYRFYHQGAADFWRDTYTLAEIEDPDRFVTRDGKLDAMTTHTIGGQVVVALGLLGADGWWQRVRVDAIVERLLQDSIFGDAWVLQAGVTVPLE
jgi:hypothetical protein